MRWKIAWAHEPVTARVLSFMEKSFPRLTCPPQFQTIQAHVRPILIGRWSRKMIVLSQAESLGPTYNHPSTIGRLWGVKNPSLESQTWAPFLDPFNYLAPSRIGRILSGFDRVGMIRMVTGMGPTREEFCPFCPCGMEPPHMSWHHRNPTM